MTFSIAVLGAECTGKSTLCVALAKALSGIVIPETLREFCEAHARAPFANEQNFIMDTQIQRLGHLKLLNPRFIVMDSAPISTALYSQIYFNDVSLKQRALTFHREHFDLSLIVQPEFGWQADPLPWMRDSQVAQGRFNQLLKQWIDSNPDLLIAQLTGSLNNRVSQAIAAIEVLTSL